MTLRPTFQTTQQLEDNKYEVLKTVLENASGIIFVGFSFADKDMQKVFLQAVLGRAEKPSIYFVDKGRNIVRNPRAVALVSLLPKKLKTSTFRNIQHKNFIKMDSDDFFRKLAKALFEPQNFLTEIAKKKNAAGWRFSEKEKAYLERKKNELSSEGKAYPNVYSYRIRDILFRHGISTELKNKILVELIIFALTARGKFKGNALVNSKRIRSYMQEGGEVADVVSQLVAEGFFLTSRRAPAVQEIFGEQTYYCVGQCEDEMIEIIMAKLKEKFPGLKKIPDKVQAKLEGLMKGLTRDFDYELTGGLKNLLFFKRPEILRNLKELLE